MERAKLQGQTFGKLTVIDYVFTRKNMAYWECVCECGNKIIVGTGALRGGNTSSCGCSRQGINTTHGMSYTPEYRVWKGIKNRCYNPKAHNYKYYGEKGIVMCDEWKDDFLAFYTHVGKRPNKKMTVDRIDPYGNYEPGNVRWATWTQQANNKR